MNNVAILVVNLGSPSELSVSGVRSYLREFLSDPRVIDIPPMLRFLLLNLIILPFRPKKTLEAYKQIWTDDGSPLVHVSTTYSRELDSRLAAHRCSVFVAMRYGLPSMDEVVEKILAQNFERIVLFPMYPQYASSSTGTVVQKFFELLTNSWNTPAVSIVAPFFDHPKFIMAQSNLIKAHLKHDHHLLLSFHGLPQRHIAKSEGTDKPVCPEDRACPWETNKGQVFCYRQQCYRTAGLIASQLGITDYTVGFQSRLGRTPWIKPYTDILLPDLRARGIERLAVAAPSFTVDCLETLEEIGMRLREQWSEIGGTSFELIPCLNDSEDWIDASCGILEPYLHSL